MKRTTTTTATTTATTAASQRREAQSVSQSVERRAALILPVVVVVVWLFDSRRLCKSARVFARPTGSNRPVRVCRQELARRSGGRCARTSWKSCASRRATSCADGAPLLVVARRSEFGLPACLCVCGVRKESCGAANVRRASAACRRCERRASG